MALQGMSAWSRVLGTVLVDMLGGVRSGGKVGIEYDGVRVELLAPWL